jgi:hypothetical protein
MNCIRTVTTYDYIMFAHNDDGPAPRPGWQYPEHDQYHIIKGVYLAYWYTQ